MVESAINENPDVPGFNRQFQPTFPVGISDNTKVREFMQLPIFERSFVPFLVLIDRQGVIRFQHTGGEQNYFTEDVVKQATNIRGESEKLLAEPAPKAPRRTGVKKATK